MKKICATMGAGERKKGACGMVYLAITAAIFTLDFFLKKYIDKKYARKVKNPRLGGMICIEKFYNKGATLNLLAKHPKAMTVIHSVIMVFVAVIYYFAMRITGKKLTKTGLAMLAGGGLSNLYDRYTKHHVVDYVRFQTGPKWFRRIIFNVSDFFIFIGAVLAEMALSWILRDDKVTSVFIGASKPEQILDNIKIIGHTDFTEEELQKIETIVQD